ncbi:monofunctional biosynthetic peptidoglycan transglycosylase [Microbulbifer hydrolyticus]|uniref:Biosynthetic peptidoglycan transglycosylase n=1 Tax=Microbulbifer hydrolyticus TaxID=48074 RepID=A0A6P1TI62_9GAMM|nr:monofunctional biosynthetic peptidoglycan transglycosylase [Microbulbifer hydrolyticus]MBB5211905.1 monofunctional biosynthetic peptidoglycan transglycosylase [Microbulbifer hydrolyticus]QHQ40512.1 monofunctional biosynthetic peptidoglycan transglycosylase [Microbulbifer hydrolyticus]
MARPKYIFQRTVKLALWLGTAFAVTSTLLVLTLRWVNPPSSMVIQHWQIEHGRNAQQVWQPLENISPNLQMAVIAAEDQKFPQHFGFDFGSLQKAFSENRKRTRGASTITQQTAKNLFLWNGRSYVRKGLEAWFTLLMELLWPKQRILEVYLNIAEFDEGVYGAEAAARHHFGNSARHLSRWQSGLLAAVLPSPRRMSASYPSEYVQGRAHTINRQARQLGGARYVDSL